MMLLERWLVAGVLAAAMASGLSASQSSNKPEKAAKPAPPAKIVQPDEGPPPDQAQQPDQGAPLDQTVPPEPPAGPPPAIVDEAAPPPAVAAPPPAAAPEAEILAAPAPAPAVALPVAPHYSGTPEQQQLQKDAALLLERVQELKVEVDKAGSNTLSIAAVRKADEVQRLTKNLKERMRVWSQPAPNN